MFKSAFVFLVVFTAAVDGPAQDRVDPPLVTVSGQAEVMVQPDEVVFNLRAVTAFPPSGWFADQSKAGNIGGAVLRRFKVIFDYSRARMILEPNKYFSEPFEHDMSGLSVVSESPAFKAVRVNRVLTQSPAEEAGIKPGDEIVSVDGRLAASLKLVSLRELLRRPGKVFSLKIKRETNMITVKLRTRRLI